MFDSLATVVIRRGWIVILSWGVITGLLFFVAPPFDRVSRDDDVRFFPAGFPTVVGQDLVEAGFPRDAASSQVVLIHERLEGPLTDADLTYVDQVASELFKFSEAEPDLELKKIDTHRTPVIGPRLLSKAVPGSGQAVLTIASLRGTYLSKAARLAVGRIEEFLKARTGIAFSFC